MVFTGKGGSEMLAGRAQLRDVKLTFTRFAPDVNLLIHFRSRYVWIALNTGDTRTGS